MREQASLLARVILASVCQTAAVKSVFPYLHFVLYAQHEFLQSLCLPPALSRMNSLSLPSTPLAHLDTQPLQSRRVQDKDDVCKRRGLCLRPVQHTHHTHTHTHTQHTHTNTRTHTFSGRRSQCGLLQSIQPAGAAGAKWGEDSPSVSESVKSKFNGSCAADGEANMRALRVKAIPKRVRDMHAASGD